MPRREKQLTFTDYRKRTGRGGPRPGAGRPRGPRPRVWHRERAAVPGECPVHVTLRLRPDLPSLREGRFVKEWRRSLAEAAERGSFRVNQYSLQTPREVRRALAYVLLNARRHLAKRRHAALATGAVLDPASSARWFDGWRALDGLRARKRGAAPEVARPRTWMLRVGWRRHGLVDPAELPGEAASRR
jgi:hypothetical protein